MDPFELTKDPDGGGITVRVKSGYVVLTREEERRVIERIAEMRDENARLREQVTQLRDDFESERDYADQMEAKEKKAVTENEKLRELVVRMRPICVEGKRCTFADRIHINSTMEELRIEVG